MKPKLYIDFDGVILNTIEVSYQRIKEKYQNQPLNEHFKEYYQSINWHTFLNECTPINNSIDYLKEIINSELYDVTVLTHVLSKHEEDAKRDYLKTKVPELKFIPVTKPAPKWASVECQNAILVDDYTENLKTWQEHGGIPIKFSQKNKQYEYKSIKSLEELITEYKNIKNEVNKKLTKNKYQKYTK